MPRAAGRKKPKKTLKKKKTTKRKVVRQKKTVRTRKVACKPKIVELDESTLAPTSESDDIETAKLVVCVQKNNDAIAFAKLFGYLEYYIKLFGKKYRIPGCDSDEIEQECLFALRYKAIADFNPERGRFRSFAILCIKRHLFSLIKGNNQLKRRVLNTSLSLDQERTHNGDSLTLSGLVASNGLSAEQQSLRDEDFELQKAKLFESLSDLEREVLKCYLQQMHYDEIVKSVKKAMPGRKITAKAVDNSLCRARQKAQTILKTLDIFEK